MTTFDSPVHTCCRMKHPIITRLFFGLETSLKRRESPTETSNTTGNCCEIREVRLLWFSIRHECISNYKLSLSPIVTLLIFIPIYAIYLTVRTVRDKREARRSIQRTRSIIGISRHIQVGSHGIGTAVKDHTSIDIAHEYNAKSHQATLLPTASNLRYNTSLPLQHLHGIMLQSPSAEKWE